MRPLSVTALVAAVLIAAGTAGAGGWATVQLSSTPTGPCCRRAVESRHHRAAAREPGDSRPGCVADPDAPIRAEWPGDRLRGDPDWDAGRLSRARVLPGGRRLALRDL